MMKDFSDSFSQLEMDETDLMKDFSSGPFSSESFSITIFGIFLILDEGVSSGIKSGFFKTSQIVFYSDLFFLVLV